MHHRLGSATLLQLAFHGEDNPNFLWEESHWDNVVVKKKKKKHKKNDRSTLNTNTLHMLAGSSSTALMAATALPKTGLHSHLEYLFSAALNWTMGMSQARQKSS